MSAVVVSLLRVMTLRDAEGLVLEAGKVPQLRRKGQVEALSMPAIDAQVLEDFARPLVDGKPLDQPLMVSFTEGGTAYPITVERVASGLRIAVRRGAPAKKAVAETVAVAAAATATVAGMKPEASDPAVARGPKSVALAKLLTPIVAIAKDRDASDIFVSTGQQVRIRIDGRLETIDIGVDDAELAACVGDRSNVDVAVEVEGARLRVNLFDHASGHALAARLIKERVPAVAELGLPAAVSAIVEHRDGLVLVCGPTGSGKSTTLAALIDALDHKRAAHVITLEDPIEYRFAPRRCLIHQRELGTHIPTFATGLRAALREAPDVILLGELRDRETLSAALTAAETGHLVLATLHAPSAVGAIDRMIDAFPEAQAREVRSQLAACLRVIVTQYLLPRRDGGRAAAIEYVPVTSAVANIIRKGDLHTLPTAIQSGRDAGMIPLERSLAELLDSGAVSPLAVKRIAADHDLLSALAGKLRVS